MGAHPPDAAFADEPEKREAEGRAPTGVFALTGGFASNPEDLTETDLPVVRADQDFVCVDDLGLANVDRAGLIQVAQKACASGASRSVLKTSCTPSSSRTPWAGPGRVVV
ncbi:hypothetical protein [Desulfonatronum lacustre]|uniref:hypothetical protein n=1 Tax=Desulfonatronum lacustre TaxID=66849 RepID=UPI00048BA7D7|nr:hypothetical protein [Desulfonatronum lacustre]